MEDQRIRLSKSMLKTALLDLLEKKEVDKISVSELCQTAKINRTTFYKYYGSPEDVLNEIAEEFFSHVELYLKDAKGDVAPLEQVLEYLDAQRRVVRILINTIPDPVFTERLFRIPRTLDYVAGQSWFGEDAKYAEIFVYHGGYAVIRSWLNSDRPEPAAEIARLLQSMTEKFY